ncbi:ABC transporter substrate-binding protein [Candidatus Latescibacterota bacterium]
MIFFTGLIAYAFTLGGCGGATQDSGNVFRYRLGSDPPSIDLIHCTDTTSATIVMKIFEGLVDQDPVTLEVIPALAESWDISNNGLTYTFHLIKGVQFHNGREVTSADFRFNFERCLTPENRSEESYVLTPIRGAKAMLAGEVDTLEGIETPDDYTVILHLEEPYAPFLDYLTMGAGRVAAKEGIDGDNFTPIGTGPFKFVSREHGIRVTVEANENWRGGEVGVKKVEFEVIPDVGVAFQKFVAGELDFVGEIPPNQLKLIQERYPGIVKMWPCIRVEYVGFNHTRPPFKDNPTLRRAFSYAVDRTSIVEILFEGAAEEPTGILPPGIPGRDDSIEGYPYDPVKAKKLLAEAGYPNGEGLPEITLWYNTNDRHELIFQFIQSNLNDIGVKTQLRSLDWPAYLKACESHEPDMYRLGYIAAIPDADTFLYTRLHSSQIGAAGNSSGYSNPDFDSLVTEARLISDPSKRNELYKRAERIAMDDAVWILYAYPMSQILFNPAYEGLVYPLQGALRIPLERLHLTEAAE